MRLIDADYLIDCFQMRGDFDVGWHLDEVIEEIKDTPTAYDVDKVVEELKNCRSGKQSPDICKSLSEIDVIDIVRRGGTE